MLSDIHMSTGEETSVPLDATPVGWESPPRESSWRSKDCLLYALGVGAGSADLPVSVSAVVVEVADVVGPESGQRSARAVALRVAHDVGAGELATLERPQPGGEVVADRLHSVGGGNVVQGVALQYRIRAGAAVADVVLDADR